MKRTRINVVQWVSARGEPPRGWPRVLAVGVDRDHEELLAERGCVGVPIGYACGVHVMVEKAQRAQDPERILARRVARVRKRCETRYPLFAEQMIAEHRATNPEYYDIEAIREGQAARQALYDRDADAAGMIAEYEAQMAGADGWRDWDWHDVRRRWRKHMIRASRKPAFKARMRAFAARAAAVDASKQRRKRA